MQVTKPRTQRRKLFQAPAHVRHRHFSAALSPNLKKRYGTNAVPARSGDTVRVMRGDRKGFEGKITRVDRDKYRVFVEGVTREKVDGTTIPIPIHPSKVMITNLNMDDKWRREALKRKGMLLEEEPPTPAVAVEGVKEMPKVKKARKPRRKKKEAEAEEPEEAAPEKTKKEKKARETKKPKRKRARKTEAEEEGAE